MLTVAQLAPMKDRDPYLYETLVKIVSAVNATSANAGVDPATPSPAPPAIAALKVQAANGWFDLAITDPAVTRPGLFYFAESDVTPAFFRAAGIFPGCVPEFVRATGESNAVLAGLFAVCGLAGVGADDVWFAATAGGGRGNVRAGAIALERERGVAEWIVARGKWIWGGAGSARGEANSVVSAGEE